ncbi:outer membrane protein assembly factor BamA [Sphingomonas sp.]|uniref:outer membrane protein assembly factor BamA n=1 Tax=Sphingomonas sp. TaxID=28214 RepID=UPI00286E8B6D|nr:outer membrane protein assembly factor BamA [Sphingomonas sp.]
MISGTKTNGKRTGAILLVGTILGGWSAPLLAQDATVPATEAPATEAPAADAPATEAPATEAPATEAPADQLAPAPAEPAPAPAETAAPATAPATTPATTTPPAAQTVSLTAAPRSGTIRSIAVRGHERLEPETVRSYANLAPGQEYTAETLDTALKALYATELFADVTITGAETGDIVVNVRENPVINRIVLEGNKRLKSDKILPEIKLAPRQIFTRSKARADVERIIELYKRQGRFAARVEPKTVQLDQNRVDLVFEIYEGDKSRVRGINIIGNEAFGDDRLRKEMYTRQAGGFLGFMKSNDSYDPDRLAADQQKLRAYYLTQGYADFRVVSALAELTPDRRDFVITYVVEEGERYKFGAIEAESELRDLTAERIKTMLKIEPGSWFDAKKVEDAVTGLNEVAGGLGYAFADISPSYDRDAEKRLMNITFRVGDTPRVYVERIDIQGNTVTRDKVIRREFRLNEGDAFNAIKIKRSQDRIQSLGYFQEKLEIKQTEGSGPDRVVLGLDLEEKSTGQLQLSAGYSSLEKFLVNVAIEQNNFRGMGQSLSAAINYSRYSKGVQLGFMEPHLFDRNILLGGEIYRRDYNSFNFVGGERNTTYSQTSTGMATRLGFPITEFITFGTRYSFVQDKITLDKDLFYTDPDGNGPLDEQCDPVRAGTYLCDEIGKRITSTVGFSIAYDDTNSIRPTRGQRGVLSQDFAGLGGDVKYIRTRIDGTKYFSFGSGWIFSAHGEGGIIQALQKSPGPGRDAIRITDRFFGPQLRGFDIRGIGPRVRRVPYDIEGELTSNTKQVSDALGGRAYYMGRLELEVPVSASIRNLGLRPSAFVDVGSVFMLKQPRLTDVVGTCVPTSTTTGGSIIILEPGEDCPAVGYTRSPGYKEFYLGDSGRPRLSVGIGFNWTSPFGPLRIDLAKALLKQDGDDTKLFSFNVGTQF